MRELKKTLMRKSYRPIVISLFILIFFANLFAEDIQCEWKGVERIVAVGDLHGDYDNFIKILKEPKIGIIDDNHRWIGGKTHLVQIGDVMDRGDHAKKIFDLLIRLEKEAEEAGGKVHMLIGNHEEMNIGDRAFDRRGYVTVEQLRSFLPDKFKEKRERKPRKKFGGNSSIETGSNPPLAPGIVAYWEKQLRDAMDVDRHPVRREYVKTFNETYGKWILKHNAVIKINDTIFVHGGISEKFSTWPLKKINDVLRKELEMWRIAVLRLEYPDYDPEIAYRGDGPLWYRGFILPDVGEEVLEETVDIILLNLNAKNMVTAHTPRVIRNPREMTKYNGKIYIIDTNISRAYRSGKLSALIIKDFGKEMEPWLKDRDRESSSNENKNGLLSSIWLFYEIDIHPRIFSMNQIKIKNRYPSLWEIEYEK